MDEDILKEKTLLVVDDENDLRDIISSELEFMGAKVFQAENISIAQTILSQNHIDLIVSDIRMPGGTGIDLLNIVKTRNSYKPPVILITGFADITVEDAFEKGAEALVNKPFKLDDLIKMIVRYTAPIEMRFKESNGSGRAINPDMREGHFFLGRGGFSTVIKLDGKKIDLGETMSFDFHYDGKHIAGQGACRWVRASDKSPKEAFIGVEFMNLNQDTFDIFRSSFEARAVAPYIPAFKK